MEVWRLRFSPFCARSICFIDREKHNKSIVGHRPLRQRRRCSPSRHRRVQRGRVRVQREHDKRLKRTPLSSSAMPGGRDSGGRGRSRRSRSSSSSSSDSSPEKRRGGGSRSRRSRSRSGDRSRGGRRGGDRDRERERDRRGGGGARSRGGRGGGRRSRSSSSSSGSSSSGSSRSSSSSSSGSSRSRSRDKKGEEDCCFSRNIRVGHVVRAKCAVQLGIILCCIGMGFDVPKKYAIFCHWQPMNPAGKSLLRTPKRPAKS